MRVKRLEIQGFKSFKDKTVIHFDHSITGIVGPNGCGKSNIVDAFFWVMGEQSYKHMRGTGSDDLIFNGSSKYQPLGLAEATLVLETDYDEAAAPPPAGATVRDIPVHLRSKEISVTRRVFRTGEGEYFINGVPARLKDIKELFMDTGVGAKGYSVIEQGQIGKIVNAKPEERRLLIEEAAGIAKYKARKQESLRKMEATQLNLARLHDIIQEIERNLGSLERQAQKARQYNKYKTELLDKEMTWGRRKVIVLRQRLESLQRTRDALEQELAGLKAELQTVENAIEVDRVAHLHDTKLAEDLQSTVSERQNELTRAQSALDLSRRRQGDLAAQLETLARERGDLETTLATEQDRLTGQEVGSNLAESEFENAARSALVLEERVSDARMETGRARTALEQKKRELITGISQSADFASRAAQLASKAESARENSARLAAQIEAQTERVAQAQAELDRAQAATGAAKERRRDLQTQAQTAADRLKQTEQGVRECESKRAEADRGLTQLQSRRQSLEELATAHEGFGDGPKAALAWARASGFGESLRAVADALQVSPGFESALEGWLEGRLETLFADDLGLALNALDQIQNARQGRAAVQVTSEACRAPAARTEDAAAVRGWLESAGFAVMGPLSESVQARDAASEALIDRVMVVERIEPLASLLAAPSTDGSALSGLRGWALVARDGKAFEASGLLRGGSTESDRATSLLGRKRAIADLRAQEIQAEVRLGELENEARAQSRLTEEAREALRSQREALQTLEVELSALERDVVQGARARKEARSQCDGLENDATTLAEEAERAETDRAATEARIHATAERRAELERHISEEETALADRTAAQASLESELQTLRVNEASLRERSRSLRRELDGARSVCADRERRLQEVQRILARASREHEEHSGGDEALESRIGELTQVIHTDQGLLSGARDRIELSSRKVNEALERIKYLHTTGNEKTAEANGLAIEAERVSSEVSFLVQNLEEKYGPGCLERPVTSPIQEEMTEPVITREMTAEEEILLGEEVERLRERLRRLGEVNPSAIEEYEELNKRHEYLLSEKNDLEQSILNLQAAIEHINKTSEERFRKAFTAIAERFERLFPIIFGGGAASLTLVYPEGSTDILEAGVDIMAQPPGKKVSNITLLSGGEKALTAVSLIFAIFMVKPSPFCVLDEVDAPLDDANIGKFNALLREMAAKSQFIVITHNKKTMELNDTLFGVTMEEPGVSKMVSIQIQ